MLLAIILAVIFIFAAEGFPLIRNRQWKDLTTLGFLLGIALFLMLGNKLGIPAPVALLDDFLNPLGKAVFK